MESFPSEPPLAFNTNLILAATNHSEAMLAANSQFHSPSDYLTNPAEATGTNGQAYYPVGSSYWAAGENIFAYSGTVGTNAATSFIDYFEDGFLLDWGNPDFGHLTNILAPGPSQWTPGVSPHYPYSEIGIGILTNVTPTVPPPSTAEFAGNVGLNVGPNIVTQEFGFNSGNPILTGDFYLDSANTGFYAPGEGYGGVTVTATGLGGQGTFQTTTWSTGGYSLQLPSGTYAVTAAGGGMPSPLSTTVTLNTDNVEWEYGFKTSMADQPVPGTYLNNGKTDVAVYRASTGQWFIDGDSQPISFGGAGMDVPEPGNYTGVGHDEIAVYRPSTAQWFVLQPNGVGEKLATFGGAGMDDPVPGDYDNLGHTEVAVYRPSTAQWFVLGANGVGRKLVTFGAPNTDEAVPGDYDGVGYTEPAVYRPSTGQWFVYGPNGGHLIATMGGPNDIPMPGDYDGVGHDEPAVYRPSTGQWFIDGPNGVRVVSFGVGNLDLPIHGDFDGENKSDLAVFRPSTATWYIRTPTEGDLTYVFGEAGVYVPISAGPTSASYVPTPGAQATGSSAAGIMVARNTAPVKTQEKTRHVFTKTAHARPLTIWQERWANHHVKS